MGILSLIYEIMEQSRERTVEILNAIQSGAAAETPGIMEYSAIGTAWQLGMAALIMGCSVVGTVVLLKLIKQFFEDKKEDYL